MSVHPRRQRARAVFADTALGLQHVQPPKPNAVGTIVISAFDISERKRAKAALVDGAAEDSGPRVSVKATWN